MEAPSHPRDDQGWRRCAGLPRQRHARGHLPAQRLDGRGLHGRILNLKSQGAPAAGGRRVMGIQFSSGEQLSATTKIFIEDIITDHEVAGVGVGLAIQGRFTDADPSADIA